MFDHRVGRQANKRSRMSLARDDQVLARGIYSSPRLVNLVSKHLAARLKSPRHIQEQEHQLVLKLAYRRFFSLIMAVRTISRP
jgi:hypothetical protein